MQNGQFAAMLGSGLSKLGAEIARTEALLQQKGMTPAQEGFCRHRLGLAFYETGDLRRAGEQLERLLSLAGEEPALRRLQADALFHLGLIDRLLRRTDREACLFQEAANRYAALGEGDQAGRCQLEAAWGFLLAGDATRALPALKEARAGLRATNLPDLAASMGMAEALWLSMSGDREGSNQRCMELLDRPPLQPVQRAYVAWILGCNALDAGEITAAAFHAAIAHSYAVMAWWPPQLEQINQLRRRIRSRG